MIRTRLEENAGVLVVSPEGPLESTDFERVARQIDPYIEEKGRLRGLMVLAESFPGWEDFGALVSHLRFVRDHHRDIARVAAVSDSRVLAVMPSLVNHFVNAEVRHFDYDDRDAAWAWLTAG